MDDTQEQLKNSKVPQLLPYQFKKGQSGNPGGRPKGASMKQWVQTYLASLDEEERLDFLEGQSKTDIWKMGEGNPESKTDITTGGEKIVMSPEAIALAKEYEEKLKENL